LPVLGSEECDALRLFAAGDRKRIRIEGNDAVFDDGSWVSYDVLRYLLAVDPPLLLDAGTQLEHSVCITAAGRRALERCGEVAEERP